MKAVEIQNFARVTLLALLDVVRRDIGRRLFSIAAGNHQDLVSEVVCTVSRSGMK